MGLLMIIKAKQSQYFKFILLFYSRILTSSKYLNSYFFNLKFLITLVHPSMSFYSVLFIHLKLLSKSKIHILSQLVVKSKSFDFINFIKLIEVNRNENIRSYFINKDKTINWFIQSFSYDKLA